MASYAELFEMHNDSALRNRVAVAAAIKARNLLVLPTPTAAQVAWAGAALAKDPTAANRLLYFVVADHADLAVGAISTLTDEQIQASVDKAVDALTGGA